MVPLNSYWSDCVYVYLAGAAVIPLNCYWSDCVYVYLAGAAVVPLNSYWSDCVYVYLAGAAVVPLNCYWSDNDSCCVQSVYCGPCHDNEHTTTWLGVEVKALLANCCPRLQPHQASASAVNCSFVNFPEI